MLVGQSHFDDLLCFFQLHVLRLCRRLLFGGGQVLITSGKFVFSTSEAYLIEKGKIHETSEGCNFNR